MRSLVRACIAVAMSMGRSSSLQLAENCSSPVRRPVPVMRTWIYCRSFLCASNPNLVNSWVAGSLDSAWRAVDQYLALHHPKSQYQKDFWKLWGKTEYWDEASNEGLVESDRKLMERNLVIALHKDGVMPKPN